MMSANEYDQPSFGELATEVALILKRYMDARDVLRLLEIVFLDVDEAAALFNVKSKTIRSWVNDDVIPYRKANGKIIFLLAELLLWTLPENDKHTQHRLATVKQCRIAADKVRLQPARKESGL
jgi:hypothetical protein